MGFLFEHSKEIGYTMMGLGAVVFVASWIALFRGARRRNQRPWDGGF